MPYPVNKQKEYQFNTGAGIARNEHSEYNLKSS